MKNVLLRLLPAVLLWCLWPALQPAFAVESMEAQAPEAVTLQLKWKHQFQFAGYYAAKAKGFYSEAGLEVTFLEAERGVEPASAVLKGKADYGIATSDLVLLRSRGYPVVVLGPIFQHSPLILLSTVESGVDTVHDLKGRTVAMEAHAAELIAYLESEGIDIDDIKLVHHSFDPSQLIEGEVDAISAYSTDEPAVLQESGIAYRIFTPRAGGIDFYGDTLFTTEEVLEQHPERTGRFVQASNRGWEYALEHPDEIIDLILTEYSTRHSREHLEYEALKTAQLILPQVVEIGYSNPGRWRYIANVYASRGMMPAEFDMDGFIYDPNAPQDLTPLYLYLALSISGLGLVVFILFRLLQLNLSLKKEIEVREEMRAEMAAGERRYRLLVEGAPFPVIISSFSDGRILYLNPQAERQFKTSLQRALHTPVRSLYSYPDDRDRLQEQLEQHFEVEDFEAEMCTATGETFWANIKASVTDYEHEKAVFTTLSDVTARKMMERELRRAVEYDQLTGVYSRRRFFEIMDAEVRRAKRYGRELSVLMLDIDRFKEINDTYGHQAGDEYLREFTRVCRSRLRTVDMMGRLGGEEFAVLLPETSQEHAGEAAERLLQAVRTLETETATPHPARTTLSIGVSSFTPQDTAQTLLTRADRALYQAKNQGRDSVETG